MSVSEQKQFKVANSEIENIARKGKESFFFFTRAILGYDKLTKRIHRPLCQHLQDSESRRKVVILPRDWFKSTIATIAYPLWLAVKNPNIRVLIVQNTFVNSCKKLAAIREQVNNNSLFRVCYPEVLPRKSDVNKTEALCLNREKPHPESTFECAGTSTEVTSRHFDLIIEDDTVAPEFDHMTGSLMQPSQAQIEKCIGWHRLAVPLLVEPAESQILVVGTRWVERDLLGHILTEEPQYDVYQRSCREDAEGNSSKEGELTWATDDNGKEKFSQRILDEIESALGPYMFAALYLNNPTSAKNQLFKPEWILYYDQIPNMSHLITLTSIDLATGDASVSDPDYNVIITLGYHTQTNNIYVLEYIRHRADPTTMINDIFKTRRKWKPEKILIESVAYQRVLSHFIVEKQKQLGEYFEFTQIKGRSASKGDRIKGMQPFFATNRMFLGTHMVELESELKGFPYAAHDDIIDPMSDLMPEIVKLTKQWSKTKPKLAFGLHSATKILQDIKQTRLNKKFNKKQLSRYDRLKDSYNGKRTNRSGMERRTTLGRKLS